MVQPFRPQLGTLQHPGNQLLSGGAGSGIRFGQPEIWNSDQGSQFTAPDFLAPLKQRGVSISMDGRGRALDNVFIEAWGTEVGAALITLINPRCRSMRTAACTADFESPVCDDRPCKLTAIERRPGRNSSVQRIRYARNPAGDLS